MGNHLYFLYFSILLIMSWDLLWCVCVCLCVERWTCAWQINVRRRVSGKAKFLNHKQLCTGPPQSPRHSDMSVLSWRSPPQMEGSSGSAQRKRINCQINGERYRVLWQISAYSSEEREGAGSWFSICVSAIRRITWIQAKQSVMSGSQSFFHGFTLNTQVCFVTWLCSTVGSKATLATHLWHWSDMSVSFFNKSSSDSLMWWQGY